MMKTMIKLKNNIRDLLFYCLKVRPFTVLYTMQISAHTLTAHKILKNKVDLILPKCFVENVKIKEEFLEQ